MPALFALYLIVGIMLTMIVIRPERFLELLGYTLFFSLSAVPFLLILIALALPTYISLPLAVGVAIAVIIGLALPFRKVLREHKVPRPTAKELVVVLVAVAVAATMFTYFTSSETLLSVASYLTRGEAKCFEMQTFKFVPGLNQGQPAKNIRDMYSIISTPGNALFTTGLTPFFGFYTFHALYVMMHAMLLLFVFLFIDRLVERFSIALVVSVFAVLNPYVLFMEVLDRNLMACAVSAVLLYTVVRYDDRYALHGFVFGIGAGVGLRFLPLTFLVPILLLYVFGKKPRRAYGIFLGVAALVFAFNIPHLFFHGFSSMGETTPIWKLLIRAFVKYPRTPFMPFPNSIYYPVLILKFFGLIVGALLLTGLVAMIVENRKMALVLALMVLPTYLVVASQPNWIEGDKARIMINTLFALMAFIGYGLHVLTRKKRLFVFAPVFVAVTLALLILAPASSSHYFPPRQKMYRNKPLYQRDNVQYNRLLARTISRVSVLPDYRILFRKTDLSLKKVEEAVVKSTLFSPDGNAKLIENEWVKRWIDPSSVTAPPEAPDADKYVTLQIDLERLVDSYEPAVARVEENSNIFIDLQDKPGLLDVYFKQCKANWQGPPIPIVSFPRKQEVTAQKELFIDLNSFTSFGTDELGFVRVNLISFKGEIAKETYAQKTAMTALPQDNSLCVILVRIPEDYRIVIRNWFVDLTNGTPHRVDSWSIEADEQNPKAVFHPWEPESYL